MLNTIYNKGNKWLVVALVMGVLGILFPGTSSASRYTVQKKEDIYANFSNHRDTNFSSRPYLMVGDYTYPATMERTITGSYIKFETIPHRAQQELVKAEWHFRMLTHLGDDDATLGINQAAHSWREDNVTGNHHPSSLSGGEYFVEANIDASSTGWKTVDITPIVRGWLDGSIDPDKGISVQRRNTGWLIVIDRRNHPSYLTVEYRDNIGEGGGSEMGPSSDSSSDSSDDDGDEVDEGVAERTEVLRLIFPADGEKITDQTPTFVWSERNRSYDLSKLVLVLKKENGDRVFDTEVDLNGTSYTSSRQLPPGKYKWYIKGYWNDEEVFKTDRNEFEITAEEEGLTDERGAVEEETNADSSETDNSTTGATTIPTIPTEETGNQTTPTTNASETTTDGNKKNDLSSIYKWLVIALLAIIAGLLGWMAKNKMANKKDNKVNGENKENKDSKEKQNKEGKKDKESKK